MADVIFYDGECGLCHGLVRFVLARDRRDHFRFAALQGNLARQTLEKYGRHPQTLDTVYLIVDYGQPSERVLEKARAGLQILTTLGGGWKLAGVLKVLPTALLNVGYDFIARHRYGWFGKADQCSLPNPQERHKFLSDGSPAG